MSVQEHSTHTHSDALSPLRHDHVRPSSMESIRHSEKQVLQTIAEQAKNPPGKDHLLGSFYAAFLKLSQSHDSLGRTLIRHVIVARDHITKEHFTNLLFRAVQFIELRQKGATYIRQLHSEETWCAELLLLLNNSETFQTLVHLLTEKNTTTTIYQRGAGEQAVMAAMARNNPIRVIELGCGGNHLLPGMDKDMPFAPVVDHTHGFITQFIAQPLNIEMGLGVDREDSNTEENRAWRHACTFYPKELGSYQDLLAFEEAIKGSQHTKFMQRDVLQLAQSPEVAALQSADFIFCIINTFIYQLSVDEQRQVIDFARTLVGKKGLVFIQDFAEKNPSSPTGLHFVDNWGKQGAYRLFATGEPTQGKILELIQWNSGRCTEAFPGDDLAEFQQLLKQ